MAAHLLHPGLIGAYVYAITVDSAVRYIGKGRRYRVLEHFRNARLINEARAAGHTVRALPSQNKLAKAMRNGATLDYRIIANGLSDEDAFERERREIAAAAPGQLWNILPGGRGVDGDYMKRLWSDPGFRDFCIGRQAEGRAADPEWRERQRAKTIAAWSDPKFREGWMKQHRALWDDPVAAEERRELLRRVWADPQKSARKRELVKSQWTPERRVAQSENRRKAWADPEFKRKAAESIKRSRSPEVLARIGQAVREKWADPEYKARVMAKIKATKAANKSAR